MFPRRWITEIIQQHQPLCQGTMTHGILQGPLWLPLVCEAPVGMTEASLIAYRCCAKPSSLRPVKIELFTADTFFLSLWLNFFCFLFFLCVCGFISLVGHICMHFFLDKTSKKKKAATLRRSLMCLWMLLLSHTRTGSRAILLEVYILQIASVAYFSVYLDYDKLHFIEILKCSQGAQMINRSVEMFPAGTNDYTTCYAEPLNFWFTTWVNLIFYWNCFACLFLLYSITKISYWNDWMIKWQLKFYVDKCEVMHLRKMS